MQEEEFRYYRWRTLYGSRYWRLDAGFYELLGACFLADVAAHAARVERLSEHITAGFTEVLNQPSITSSTAVVIDAPSGVSITNQVSVVNSQGQRFVVGVDLGIGESKTAVVVHDRLTGKIMHDDQRFMLADGSMVTADEIKERFS